MSHDPSQETPKMLPMKVGGFVLDAHTGEPVVILTNEPGDRCLPIFIGRLEASSIALAMQESPPRRPMSHDMMKTLLDSVHATVKGVVIHDVRENTFYSTVQVETGDGLIDIDARPSDGIALALRTRAPIFVSDRIPLTSIRTDEEETKPERDPDALKAYVETLKPSDFLKSE
jgi:bifunctional DNase/RNase